MIKYKPPKYLEISSYMKKEAVMARPKASRSTASVGYHASGTGLEIGFADGA